MDRIYVRYGEALVIRPGKKMKRREENLVEGSRSAVKQVRVCANEDFCEA